MNHSIQVRMGEQCPAWCSQYPIQAIKRSGYCGRRPSKNVQRGQQGQCGSHTLVGTLSCCEVDGSPSTSPLDSPPPYSGSVFFTLALLGLCSHCREIWAMWPTTLSWSLRSWGQPWSLVLPWDECVVGEEH